MVAPSLVLVLYGAFLLGLPNVELCRAEGAGIGEDDLDKVIEDLAKTVAESQVNALYLLTDCVIIVLTP